jgi:(4-(4-[2-(gamma-L-glutamylamino)ethyl]phenoxymethyl)furan-2-yl)methanamine synthase
MNANPSALGLDIGGANLKAVHSNGAAILQPFELWRRPVDLAAALAELVRQLPPADRYALTMTGELCDCFETKRAGVNAILDAAGRVLPVDRVRVWTTDGDLVTIDAALKVPLHVAAANWHALATFAGRYVPDGSGLVIDAGSTTTDVVPLQDGVPVPRGKTDAERLRTGELVYTGGRRTPVCALAGERVMAEMFATVRDVLLVLDLEEEDAADRSTADGRPATKHWAHARLARMLGDDGDVTPWAETQALARRVFDRQQALLIQAIGEVVGRLSSPLMAVVVSGSAEYLVLRAWASFARQTAHVGLDAARPIELSTRIGSTASTAACAYALAVLATERSHAWL